jgi:hypothetical protein
MWDRLQSLLGQVVHKTGVATLAVMTAIAQMHVGWQAHP